MSHTVSVEKTALTVGLHSEGRQRRVAGRRVLKSDAWDKERGRGHAARRGRRG